MEGVREDLGILQLGDTNEVRKHSIHCQGSQFVRPGRTCLALAAGDGVIRSSNILRAGLDTHPSPEGHHPHRLFFDFIERSNKRMWYFSHHSSFWLLLKGST